VAHNRATDDFGWRHLVVGGAAAVLAGVVSAGVLSNLQGKQAPLSLRIAAAAIAALSAVLVALQTHLNYGSRAERHRRSSRKYGALVDRIDEMLIGPPSSLRDRDIHDVRAEFDKIKEIAPNVPPRVWRWAAAAVDIEAASHAKIDASTVPRHLLWPWPQRLQLLLLERRRPAAAAVETEKRLTTEQDSGRFPRSRLISFRGHFPSLGRNGNGGRPRQRD
jgi:hypothetical protein